MKRVWLILLLLLSFIPASNSNPIEINVPGVTNKAVQGDISGTLFGTERYPAAWQYGDPVIVISALVVAQSAGNQTSALTPATPYTVSSIMQWKWAEITVTGGTAVSPWKIKFLGSSDASSWHYLMDSKSGSIGGAGGNNADTLGIRMHGATPAGNPLSFPIVCSNNFPVVDKYLAVVCVNDSTANGNLTFTVKINGRMY